MAKGNMFLGMARGKVGDVVFYRADGQQLSRVRNRNPRNPRSNAQLFQRAIMATIVQAYTAGKVIFDHSFQGFSVGAQNQREFIKRNAKMLRDLVAADINTPIAPNLQKSRVVAPGVSVPTANPYIISRGSYDQKLFSLMSGGYELPVPESGETVKDYFTRCGMIVGDIYTFVFFSIRKDVVYQSAQWDDVLASQNFCDFGYCRLIVKDVSTVTGALTTWGQLFTIETYGNGISSPSSVASIRVDSPVYISNFYEDIDTYTRTGAFGVIRSRFDQDLRSNSELYMEYGDDAESMYGIIPDYLLDAWKAGTSSIGNSDLILEGGEG